MGFNLGMGKKKLLVTGISGFLGWHVQNYPQNQWEIIGVYHRQRPVATTNYLTQIDLTDFEGTTQVLDELKPNAILHLAANTDLDACETDSSTNHINVESAVHLAKWCEAREIPFVMTSSDAVFDGEKPFYNEESSAQPVCVYGRQKLLAEAKVMAIYPQATIARMPLMYGLPDNGHGFMVEWVNRLARHEAIRCFQDEYRTMISGASGAAGLFLLLEKKAAGLFHLGGRERISRYEFANRLAQVFEFNEELIRPGLQSDASTKAKRPADVSMISEKAYQLGFQPGLLLEELQQLKQDNFIKPN